MARPPDLSRPRPTVVSSPKGQFHGSAKKVDVSWADVDERRELARNGCLPRHDDDDVPTNTQTDMQEIELRLEKMLLGIRNGLGFDNRYRKVAIYSFILGVNALPENDDETIFKINQLAKTCLADRLHHMHAEDVSKITSFELTPDEAVTMLQNIVGLWQEVSPQVIKKVRRIEDGYRTGRNNVRPGVMVSQLTTALMS